MEKISVKKIGLTILVFALAFSIFRFWQWHSASQEKNAINWEELSEEDQKYYRSLPLNMPKFPILYSSKGTIEAKVVYNEPSLYGDIVVFEYADGIRCFLIEGVNESCWNFRNKVPSTYTKNLSHLLIEVKQQRKVEDVLVIGVGAGTLFKYLDTTGETDMNIDAVEINPDMPKIAQEYFNFPKHLVDKIHIDDGRHYLETTDKKYDAIILDLCYVNDANAHLWTEEFYKLAKQHLKDPENGVIMASRAFVETEDSNRLDHMIGTAMRESFSELYMVKRNTQPNQFDMDVFLASNRPLDIEKLDNPELKNWVPDASHGKAKDEKLGELVSLFLPASQSIIEQTTNNFGSGIFKP